MNGKKKKEHHRDDTVSDQSDRGTTQAEPETRTRNF